MASGAGFSCVWCASASRNIVKDHVGALAERKHLTRHGAGRGAWYAPGRIGNAVRSHFARIAFTGIVADGGTQYR
jgi:hypothetical protein